jgi:D-alanine-D-alanine ligase
MKKIQKHIEIVRSTIVRLSSLSQESCDAIYTVLANHYALVGVSVVNNLADLEALVAKQPDLVFTGMKYLPSDQTHDDTIWISEYLETHGIDHTGSSQCAIEYELNKPSAKQRVLDAGLRTAPFLVIKHGQTYSDASITLHFPLFVKPTSLGGGQGIDDKSVVHNLAELHTKVISMAAACQADILVEEFLPGREFSVGILQDEYSEELLVMPIELVADGNSRGDRILSKKVKSLNQETALAVVDVATRALIIDFASRVFYALGGRDYGRIDIRMDSSGAPHFLEANLIPSLIDGYGSFPKACALNIGMDYETMILAIVSLGLARCPALEAPVEESALVELFSSAVVA